MELETEHEPAATSRRGFKRYETNPFIGNALSNTKAGMKRLTNKDNSSMMIVGTATGEVIAPAGFWQAQEVDRTQFVKLYVNGVKAFKGLSSAGTKVFELLYLRVQAEIGKDVIYLSFGEIEQQATPISKTTFMRGMKELVEKGFIAESTVQTRYFLNPDFMWNGDRLAFVKEFFKAPAKPTAKRLASDQQTDIFEFIDHVDQTEA